MDDSFSSADDGGGLWLDDSALNVSVPSDDAVVDDAQANLKRTGTINALKDKRVSLFGLACRKRVKIGKFMPRLLRDSMCH